MASAVERDSWGYAGESGWAGVNAGFRGCSRYNSQLSSPDSIGAMTLDKSFEPKAIESRWYPFWEEHGYFRAGFDPGKKNPEDVDLCARLWRSGRRVMLCPAVRVVHDARRASRRDLRHMRWHAASMARYFRKHALRSGLPAS